VRPATSGVVYVVAKAPRAGQTKTRLCPPLTPLAAAALARAFLLDVLDLVGAAGLTARIICRDVAEQAALRELAGGRATVHVQDGSGLGDALESAFRQGLADGFSAVAVLGADTPTLPPAVLVRAFQAVAEPPGEAGEAGEAGGADVALGRSDDGGYYVLVARAVHPTLFRDMPWSTADVGAITLERCRAAGLRAAILPTWSDVDDAPALAALRSTLAGTPAGVARHTRAALAEAGLGLPALPEVIPPATPR
jgi:rSAM/selenodomain-associated transferase 1